MGFYGRVVAGSNQNLQFDRVYPNKDIMDQYCESDNIFIGRRVLIDYEYNGNDIEYIKNEENKYTGKRN